MAAAAISSFPANVTHILVLRLHHVLFWNPDPHSSHVELQRDRPDSSTLLHFTPPRDSFVFLYGNIYTPKSKRDKKKTFLLAHCALLRSKEVHKFFPLSCNAMSNIHVNMHLFTFSLDVLILINL